MHNASSAYSIFPCGDHAVTIDFGSVIDEEVNKNVLLLFDKIKQRDIVGIKDVIPAYSSITVVYDVIKIRSASQDATAYQFMQQQLEYVLSEPSEDEAYKQNVIQIPACYEAPFAPDIQDLANKKNISVDKLISIHTAKKYRVYMLGFLPGFAYMGKVDESIVMPRKAIPRKNVAEGSIGIAGSQTGIYSIASPGGWNIIAQTPLKLFDASRDEPVLLKAGDYVQFYEVTAAMFNQIKGAQ